MHPNIGVFSVARIERALLGTNNAKKIGYRERKRKIERKNKQITIYIYMHIYQSITYNDTFLLMSRYR